MVCAVAEVHLGSGFFIETISAGSVFSWVECLKGHFESLNGCRGHQKKETEE